MEGEADEEQTNSLTTVLEVMREKWPDGAAAKVVAAYADAHPEFKGALEHAAGKAIVVTTPTVITWRLKSIKDAPVRVGNQVLVLRYMPDAEHGGVFKVREPA